MPSGRPRGRRRPARCRPFPGRQEARSSASAAERRHVVALSVPFRKHQHESTSLWPARRRRGRWSRRDARQRSSPARRRSSPPAAGRAPAGVGEEYRGIDPPSALLEKPSDTRIVYRRASRRFARDRIVSMATIHNTSITRASCRPCAAVWDRDRQPSRRCSCADTGVLFRDVALFAPPPRRRSAGRRCRLRRRAAGASWATGGTIHVGPTASRRRRRRGRSYYLVDSRPRGSTPATSTSCAAGRADRRAGDRQALMAARDDLVQPGCSTSAARTPSSRASRSSSRSTLTPPVHDRPRHTTMPEQGSEEIMTWCPDGDRAATPVAGGRAGQPGGRGRAAAGVRLE